MKRRMKMTEQKAEKLQQKIDAGLVSEHFPKVAKIVIKMQYSQTGVLEPLSRTVNFFPGSYAAFEINCLCSDCIEGRFDFNKPIRAMIGTRKTASKGVISCNTCSAPECAGVEYTVAIKYS